MKNILIIKKTATYSLYVGIAIIMLILSMCKKMETKLSCSVERKVIKNLVDRKGSVVFYQKYNKYAVRIDTVFQNNIDSQIIGLPCDLPKNLQTVGAAVIINGQLKEFNSDENFSPQMGGEELYFLKIDQITKP